MTATDIVDTTRQRRARRTLLLIAAVVAAPVLFSYAFYYLFPRSATANYGELLPTVPFPALRGSDASGVPVGPDLLRGQWSIVVVAPGSCDAACEQVLYATRQARTMQNREAERVQRVWLVSDAEPPRAAVLEDHPGLRVVGPDGSALPPLPRGTDRVYLVDPAGHQVLAWPAQPDAKALSRDLARLLRASRQG